LSYPLTRKVFDFFLFTSLFVACCAVMMVYQSYTLIVGKPVNFSFAAFVFFSTVCSYNFHWFLTPHSFAPSQRLQWDMHHKIYHLLLSAIGLTGAFILFFFLKQHGFYLGVAALITFLYSAPKISFPPFQWLKKVAIGKTLFLAMAWTYVTAVLPVAIEGNDWTQRAILFSCGQFFFIYAICILFDYRDRKDDKADGIRSMITYFNERGIDILFFTSLGLFVVITFFLKHTGLARLNISLLILPAIILAVLYRHAKKNFSDYLYYFVLDGLTMLSALLLWVVNRF
jgi:4-hydroxybenzoate polyprenyltransferase